MKSSINQPLIGHQSDDPFYVFKDELQNQLANAKARYSKCKELLGSTGDQAKIEFRNELTLFSRTINGLQSDWSELDQIIQRVQMRRSNFRHIDDDELKNRQHFIHEFKKEIDGMKDFLARTAATRSGNRNVPPQKYSKHPEVASRGSRTTSHVSNDTNMFQSHQQRRQIVEQEQDEYLDSLHDGATRLGNVALAIKGELDEQNMMLDGFQNDLHSTSGRMENVLGRVDRLLKTNSRWQTNTILILIVVVIILIMLVSWT